MYPFFIKKLYSPVEEVDKEHYRDPTRIFEIPIHVVLSEP